MMIRSAVMAFAVFTATTVVQADTLTQQPSVSVTEERNGTTPTPKLGDRNCSIEANGTTAGQRMQPALTPVEINGVRIVALPRGFQNQMPGSVGPLHISVLFSAIDQPGFPDWIKLKRAAFIQGEVAGITQGEVQQELLLDQDQEACRPVRPSRIEKNEKLLCADPQQARFVSSHSIAMHLLLEDGQGHTYEIVDEFCPAIAS